MVVGLHRVCLCLCKRGRNVDIDVSTVGITLMIYCMTLVSCVCVIMAHIYRDLSFNQITAIPDGVFDSLTSLGEL